MNKKILIAHAGKTGTCAIVADMLKTKLTHFDTDLLDITKNPIPTREELTPYAAVVIGGSVRFGSLNKHARKMLDELSKNVDIPIGAFICCCYSDRMCEYEKAVPQSIRDGALGLSCFGGDLSLERSRGFDKFFIRAVRNKILYGGDNGTGIEGAHLPTISESDIAQFADKMTALLN